MPDESTPRPLSHSLGMFTIRALDRLNHASELLAAAAQGIERLSSPASTPLRHLVYEANQEILAVMEKPAAAFKRWHERNAPKQLEDEDARDSA